MIDFVPKTDKIRLNYKGTFSKRRFKLKKYREPKLTDEQILEIRERLGIKLPKEKDKHMGGHKLPL